MDNNKNGTLAQTTQDILCDNSKLAPIKFFGKMYPPLDFLFSHNARDFIVEEIPLYTFHNEGEHRILKIRKKNLTTTKLCSLLATLLHIKERDIGYAGLKDKNALTYQYISLPNKAFLAHQQSLENNENFKIMESYLHTNKIRIGHLKGNRFFIRLKKINAYNFERLRDEYMRAKDFGFPNFFGYQRFGNFGDNYLQAQKITKAIKRQNPHEKFLISSLQSHYFNLWLETRLKISNLICSLKPTESLQALKQNYKLIISEKILAILKDSKLPLIPLCGDICMHYPFGKFFYFAQTKSEEISDNNTQIMQICSDIQRLQKREIALTGLLSGIGCKMDTPEYKQTNPKVWLATDCAAIIEQSFCYEIQAYGTRRYAWVYPENMEIEYIKQESHAILRFELPSGSYATSFLEYLKNSNL